MSMKNKINTLKKSVWGTEEHFGLCFLSVISGYVRAEFEDEKRGSDNVGL